MFFNRLVNNENSFIFSAYEEDIESLLVFAYDNGKYYIADEIRNIIKDKLKI